ncbi:YkgJ family cysteine cluster protein [Kerstersia sp.]|uniref:YkgJ family cysteine cluster protein n=1 Tax=Kerstersia sp. TaxID=1930783 RepID=UPI003F91E36E
MECRPDCGACCTAPSISSPIPGMPHGKPAGTRCIQLDERERCMIFGQPGRPEVCASLAPAAQMCGTSRESAMQWLSWLENETRPSCPA